MKNQKNKRLIYNSLTGVYKDYYLKKNGKYDILKISNDLNISKYSVNKYLKEYNNLIYERNNTSNILKDNILKEATKIELKKINLKLEIKNLVENNYNEFEKDEKEIEEFLEKNHKKSFLKKILNLIK